VSDPAPVLDRRRFGLLRLPGETSEEDSLAALVRSFAASSAATLEEIRLAVAAADPSAVADLAHRLKGASALFGATRLRDACAELEREARDRADAGALSVGLGGLAAELEAARQAMERELELDP
jgi:HPt (histidine-containing phosphotransfer) domain-containing protein